MGWYRAWLGLLLAAFFNLESELYYELFSNFMGKGDKESFAHAMQAVKQPFATVQHPVGSVGEIRRQCQASGSCRCKFLSACIAAKECLGVAQIAWPVDTKLDQHSCFECGVCRLQGVGVISSNARALIFNGIIGSPRRDSMRRHAAEDLVKLQ